LTILRVLLALAATAALLAVIWLFVKFYVLAGSG
jgi:hypothetical protein